MIYTTKNFWEKTADTNNFLNKNYLWIARWGKNTGDIPDINSYPPLPPNGYSIKDAPDFWQFTSKGQVDGITTDVDLNLIAKNIWNEYISCYNDTYET